MKDEGRAAVFLAGLVDNQLQFGGGSCGFLVVPTDRRNLLF